MVLIWVENLCGSRTWIYNIASELSGREINEWDDRCMQSTMLTKKFLLLFGIALTNWFPSTNRWVVSKEMGRFLFVVTHNVKVDIGQVIFDQIVVHGTPDTVHLPIGFPSLIYEPVISHHHSFAEEQSCLSSDPKLLVADPSYCSGRHIDDLDVYFSSSFLSA